MREIALTRGKVALVDDEDYERLSDFRWAYRPQAPGYAVRKGRARTGEPRTVHMHREILGLAPGMVVDHINGNGLDNRKENLRIVDTQRNAFNRKKPNVVCTSKYKGVFRRRNRPNWFSRIKYNDKHIELGTYATEEIAASVYNFAAWLIFGDYRRVNTDDSLPELTDSQKRLIFTRCKNKAMKCGWQTLRFDEVATFEALDDLN